MTEETRVNSDGAIVDAKSGKIIVPGESAFSVDNAKEMAARSHAKRRENAIEAARIGIEAGLSIAEIKVGLYGGMSAIIAAQTQLALDISKGNASTQAAKFVLEQADLLVRPEEDEAPAKGVALDQSTALKLAELIMSNKSDKAKDQVIDA